ncbi:MAG: PAS domain S-box protein [Candidatus Dadabacteria bacterium]|nr:PAS domain S-box protein [Candidatus Dadabacteria bacterium]NIS07692.1 PAS domain S-box protein [Candidatus Dadabacteria bacterium]NIV42271.1 PAS domain S-box protein [Candidatus Dadabacteria bacterium]NIX14778.1 PAS domain S-box protein [Candidatus Dadabacteria bacterium]NIY21319.1 PAS domain S-box protein [Candidatus Dadabacteria bacterium]
MNLQTLTKKELISKINDFNDHLNKLQSVDNVPGNTDNLDQVSQLGHILDTSLNEILIFDAETFRFVFVNESARSNLGYTSEEFYDMTPLDINSELTSESAQQLVEPLINAEKDRLNFETTLKRKDGTTYPVEVYLQMSRFNGRDVFLRNVIDVTERKKAEEALKISEERYRVIHDQSPIGICLVDKDLIITHTNNKMVEMFESTHDRVLGLDLKSLKDKSFVPIIAQAFHGKTGKTEDLYSATTSSAYKWLSVSSAPIRNTEGKVINAICVV